MRPDEIKGLIEKYLTECTATIESNDEVHYTAIVISPDFSGKNRVQRQQMVYSALGNRIHDGTIHAFSIKTFTPAEWQNLN